MKKYVVEGYLFFYQNPIGKYMNKQITKSVYRRMHERHNKQILYRACIVSYSYLTVINSFL